MFNEKRIEQIRKNIQISTILSDHEKSDWLNLLELMNDKQLGELEEILGAVPQTQPTAVRRVTVPDLQNSPQPKMPPLSHIANVPADVTMTHSIPQAQPVSPQPTLSQLKPTPSQQQATPANQAQAEPTPASSASHQQATHDPAIHQPISTPPPASQVSKPQTSKPHASAQTTPHAPASAASTRPPASTTPPQSQAQLKKLTIAHLADIQGFDVSTLRQYELQSIVDAMRNAIQANGYFQILQQLEASPLYRSYIETGKMMLGHGTAKVTDPETTLTQTELEFITDLLRHMRFNTW